MRKLFYILIFILICTCLYAEKEDEDDNFITQRDSYFRSERTKLIWSIASGFGSGSAHGYRGLSSGWIADLELIRLVGEIKPENKFFKYFWLTFGANYTEYEDDHNIYELIYNKGCIGVGFQLQKQGFWEDIIPYFGGGGGFGIHMNKFGVDSSSPLKETGTWVFYMQVAGLEYRMTETVTFFIEENYTWGKLQSLSREDTNYIPDKYDYSNEREIVSSDASFYKDDVTMRQLTIRAGFRFYWGQNMFWFFPFFWEK